MISDFCSLGSLHAEHRVGERLEHDGFHTEFIVFFRHTVGVASRGVLC